MIPSIVGDERFFERIRIVPVASERRTQIDFHQRVLVHDAVQNRRMQRYRHAHLHFRPDFPVRSHQTGQLFVVQNAQIADTGETKDQGIRNVLSPYSQAIVKHGQPSVVGPDRPLVLSVHYGPESPALRSEPIALVGKDRMDFSLGNGSQGILGQQFPVFRVKRYSFFPANSRRSSDQGIEK